MLMFSINSFVFYPKCNILRSTEIDIDLYIYIFTNTQNKVSRVPQESGSLNEIVVWTEEEVIWSAGYKDM